MVPTVVSTTLVQPAGAVSAPVEAAVTVASITSPDATLAGLEDVLGRRIATIHVVGGGSRNELLNQMTADACGRAVVAGPVEATGVGNVLVQAMAVGRLRSLPDARRIVAESFDVKRFEPRDTKTWDAAYARYREIVAK